ncbi:HEAT repeat domain-containing protein [Herbivorax sp. ANBcel31]|uniref:HEAT repeat domain-containing protein n=1 Tax=Herbivorax sp. ANBcel31 TaxID=3069754 RepID=UPI0027B1EFA0|nr:HEAT repeat domain-containing protein [Herbivorax sp. ANBcel31]MDQ2085394.1 HEAT repeat domain-containing protein [Herbivorax sp. ANBcel31]
MDRKKLLFESYNKAIEKGYDRLFNDTKPENILKIKEGDASAFLDEELKEWESTELDILGGISPEKYFDSIDDLNNLIDMFKTASKICDVDVPEVLVRKLEYHGENALDKLIELASSPSLIKDEEEKLISLMAIRFLGRLKYEKAVSTLIELLYDVDFKNEVIIEEINGALVNIGGACTTKIVSILRSTKEIGNLEEYLLYTLVQIGINTCEKSNYEDIYSCIKDTFIEMDNKIIGAICIGDLGDKRAITFLRGYVEKNMDSIDYDTFCEIKAAVHKLGGNMDDINF